MKRKTLHYLIILAIAGISLAGCKHDVDLKNITLDSAANVQLNNLPIGEIKATFGDLLGLVPKSDNVTISSREGDSVLVLSLKEHYEREFHAIDLKDYFGTTESTTYLKSVAPELTYIPKDMEIDLMFPISVTFSGINDELSDERLDSLVIEEAKFTTNISSSNLNISNDDIKKVTLRLSDQFRRAKGKDITLDNFKLNQDVPITVDDFTLVMMKDPSQEPSNTNVVNTATIYFVVTLKAKNNVTVADNSGFHFKFRVDFMDYTALYGFFEAGNQASDKDEIKVPIRLPEGDTLILPVKEPEIQMLFTHGLGIPLQLNVKYIKAINADQTEIYALWKDKTTGKVDKSTIIVMEPVVFPDDPLDKTVVDTIIFDNTEEHGAISRFFTSTIDKFGYDYSLEVNKNRLAQCRLTKNTKFVLDFGFTMPFQFNPGIKVTYNDTIKDVDLERASLDSLAAMTNGVVKEIDKADLQLYLTFTNEIPLDILVDAQFLGKDGKELNIPQLHDVKIKAATISGSTTTPSVEVQTIDIKETDFDEVAKTSNVRIKARLADDTKQGSSICTNQTLSIRAGISGNVKALLDLNNLTNNNNK